MVECACLSRVAGSRSPRIAEDERGRELMYKVYILQSIKNQRYYIGHTSNLDKRLLRHNSGGVKSTKNNRPWKIVYTENYNTKSEANKRELEIKNYKGGIKFKRLLDLWKDN